MNFNPLTVQKVQAARDELGYKADHLARQMVGKQSKTIGILVPEITNSFFSTLVKGISVNNTRKHHLGGSPVTPKISSRN